MSLTRIISHRLVDDPFGCYGNKDDLIFYTKITQTAPATTKFITVAVSSETDALYVRPASLFPQCDTNTYLLRAQNAHVARKRADLRDLFNFILLLSFHYPWSIREIYVYRLAWPFVIVFLLSCFIFIYLKPTDFSHFLIVHWQDYVLLLHLPLSCFNRSK